MPFHVGVREGVEVPDTRPAQVRHGAQPSAVLDAAALLLLVAAGAWTHAEAVTEGAASRGRLWVGSACEAGRGLLSSLGAGVPVGRSPCCYGHCVRPPVNACVSGADLMWHGADGRTSLAPRGLCRTEQSI